MPETKELSIAVKAAEDWIDDVQRRLGWHDRERVYHALLAALHPLRDSLTRNGAIYLGAQLPPLLRGFYYEGWHFGARGTVRSRAAIRDGVHRDPAIDAEEVARVVFAMLSARLPPAEVEDAKAATPKPLHNLWPS